MPHEIALFWAVLAGFWLFDNLVLAPPGGDLLRIDGRGRPGYRLATRVALRGRESLLLNPLNPFDLVLPSTRSAGPVGARQWRHARRDCRRALPVLRALARLGVAYLLVLAALLALSWHWHFGLVLAALLGWHLLAWGVGLWLLLRGRQRLGLGADALAVLAAEALFVPAYTLGLAKRAARRRRVELPSLTLGLRALRRMPEGSERELWHWQLSQRLEGLLPDPGQDAGGGVPGTTVGKSAAAAPGTALRTWADAARDCLRHHG